MSANLTSLAYLVAAVLFILALRGLSSPVTSREGNRFGMIGMGVAVVATLAHHGMGGLGYALIVVGIIIGGAIGTFVALRIQMTALPQLVAAFHSLVGLAAVFVAAVLFILALRGLSSPVTSRQGNRFGMIGMGVAVVATLAQHGMGGL